jgi:bacteriocin biosynthesis cyclodehydratase domain-containing protein
LKTPDRPEVKPWLKRANDGTRFAFEYAHVVRVLEGEAVQYLLPVVLPLLDGKRTLAEISAQVGDEFEEPIRALLKALSDHDLLVDGVSSWERASPKTRETIEYLAATPAASASRAAIREAVCSASVQLIGTSSAGDEVGRALERSGIDVGRLDWDEHPRPSVALVIVAPSPAETPQLSLWNEAALQSTVAWTHILPYNGAVAIVGPLYIPGETCCFRCLQLRRAANLKYGDWFWRFEEAPAPYPAAPSCDLILGGLCADLVVRWVGTHDPALPGIVYTLEFDPVRVESQRVYRVPRCPVCSETARASPPQPWSEDESG